MQVLTAPHSRLLLMPQVHSVKFTEFNNGINPEENPSKIHIYVNRENLGFEDCDDVDPTQTLELTTVDLRENADAMLLKFVKFQRVKSLTFFIEDNAGGDITALGSLKVYGKPIMTTNMKDFKKNC
jgi:PITH domain